MTTRASSWIFEIQERLAEPPPVRAASASGLVVLVPLFVDEGVLHLLLPLYPAAEPEGPRRLGSSGAPFARGDDPWQVAGRVAAVELAVEPARVLRLGELDAVRALDGSEIVPCVGAIPRPGAPDTDELMLPRGIVALALRDLESAGVRPVPGSHERFPVFVLGGESELKLGAAELWGPPAAIVANLISRLGMQRSG